MYLLLAGSVIEEVLYPDHYIFMKDDLDII